MYTNPMSLGQIAFAAANRGEMSMEDLQKHTAISTADCLHDYPCRAYPEPSRELENYIRSRANGLLAQRDPVYSIKNGEWIQLALRIKTMNQADIDYLVWAKEWCKKAGAIDKAQRIHAKANEHWHNRPPVELLTLAFKAQELDSLERQRSIGGGE